VNAAPAITGALRVGTDLVHVPDVAASIDRFGARYLHRVYTDAELDTCRSGAGGWSPERLAARFAAKEAVLKVLRPADGVSVRDIEVGADGSGAPSVRLAGAALAQANAIGLADGTVSLSHDGQYAMAVYAAVLTTPTPLREDHP